MEFAYAHGSTRVIVFFGVLGASTTLGEEMSC
jgi:hypothetical protein